MSEEIGRDCHMHQKQQYSYYYDCTPRSSVEACAKEGGNMEVNSDDEEMAAQLRDEEIALMAMQRDLYKIKKKKQNDASSANASTSTYSVQSFGDEDSFKNIRDKEVEEEIKWLKIEFYIDIAILIILILVLVLTRKR